MWKLVLLIFLLALPGFGQTSPCDPLVQACPPQVPFSGKIGPGGNFPLFTGGTIVMQSDQDRTMVFPEFTGSVLRVITATGVSLSQTRNIIAPTAQFGYEFTIENATTGGQSIQVIGSTGTGVTIPNGQAQTVVFDGTNYVSTGGGGSGINIPQSEGVLVVKSGGAPPGGNTQYFGYTTVGGTAQDVGGDGVMLFTAIPYAPANATVNSCSVYIGQTTTGRVYCLLYDDGGGIGYPTHLLCGDTTGTVVTANAWNTISSFQAGNCPALVQGSRYYIALMMSAPVTTYYGFDTVAFHFYSSPTVPCCTPPNPVPQSILTSTTSERSSYLTVTVSGGTRSQIIPAGDRITPRTTYSLDTTLGTGYLHYDGTNYSWDSGGATNGAVVFQGTPDAVADPTCSMLLGSNNLVCTDAPFLPCPTNKTVSVNAAQLETQPDPTNPPLSLISTIVSCSSPTTAVLADAATLATPSSVTAIWGTDNAPAMMVQAAQAALPANGTTLIVPFGNYLFKTTFTGDYYDWLGPNGFENNGQHINARSNTNYLFEGNIYLVGIVGETAHPPHWQDYGKMLFYIPENTHNVHIQFDGTVYGENTNPLNWPYLNQSAVVFSVGISGPSITDINIDGKGGFKDLYGFGIHGAGGGYRINIRGLMFNHVSKGLNVNAWISDQSGNTFINSAGIETSGGQVLLSNNIFDASWGISAGGNGTPGLDCPGVRILGNTFLSSMTSTNISVSDCVVGGIVSNNTLFVSGRDTYSAGIDSHDGGLGAAVKHNLYSNNTIYCNDGFAGIQLQGDSSGNNSVIGNRMMTATGGTPCYYGLYVWEANESYSANNKWVSGGGDIFMGSGSLMVSGDTLSGTGWIWGNGIAAINPASWFLNPTGASFLGAIGVGTNLTVGGAIAAQSYKIGATNLSSFHLGDVVPAAPLPNFVLKFNGLKYVPASTAPSINGGGIPYLIAGGSVTTYGYNGVASLSMPDLNYLTAANAFVPAVNSTATQCHMTFVSASGQVSCGVYDSDGPPSSISGYPNRPLTSVCGNTVGVPVSPGVDVVVPLANCNLAAGHTYYIALAQSNAYNVIQMNNVTTNPPPYAPFYIYQPFLSSFSFPSFDPANVADYDTGINQPKLSIDLVSSVDWAPSLINSSNVIPPNYLGSGTVGTGTNCLADTSVWVPCAAGTGGGGIPYPGAGIASSNGLTWNPSYNTTTNQIPPGYISTLNQNTTGNAATATKLSTNGGANQVWAMDSTGTAQTWQTAGGSNVLTTPVHSAVYPNVPLNGTLYQNMVLAMPGCTPGGSGNASCVALTPPTSGTYLMKWFLTQTAPGSGGTCNAGSFQLRFQYFSDDGNLQMPSTAIVGRAANSGAFVSTFPFNAVANGPATDVAGLPLEFRVRGGQPILYALWLSAISNCDVSPTVTFRVFFFGPLGY